MVVFESGLPSLALTLITNQDLMDLEGRFRCAIGICYSRTEA